MIKFKAVGIAIVLSCLSNCLLWGNSRNPLLPDWTAVSYSNSTIAYGEVSLDNASAEEGDLVAAFVSEECRGVQSVVVNSDGAYVTLVINGEISELAGFYLYSQSTGLVCEIDLEIWTDPGGTIGYPPNFLDLAATSEGADILPLVDLPELIEISEPEQFLWEWGIDIYDLDDNYLLFDIENEEIGNISVSQPEWEIVSSSSVTQVFARVEVDGEPAEEGDLAGAFVNGICRAVSEIGLMNDEPFLSLSVYGTTVDQVSIHVFSVGRGMVYLCENAFYSQPGGMVGYPELLDIACNRRILESDLLLEIDELPEEENVLEFIMADNPPYSQVHAEINITTDNANQAPVMNLPEVCFEEDTVFECDLLDYSMDPEGEELVFEISSSGVLEAEIMGNMLELYPPQDWFGNTSVAIFAFDTSRFYTLDTMYVAVQPVNDPPLAVTIPPVNIVEDSCAYISLSPYITDVDSDSLIYTFSESNNITICSAAPEWEPVELQNWATGYFMVEIPELEIGDDSRLSAFSGSECIGSAGLSYYEGAVYSIILMYCEQQTEVSFKAYNSLNCKVYTTDQLLTINPNSNIGFPPDYYSLSVAVPASVENFRIEPAENWFGEETLELTISDLLETVCTEITIFVENTPDPPQLNFPAELFFAAGYSDWLDLAEFVYEPDFQEVNFSLGTSSELGEVIDGSILNIYPPEYAIGENSIEIIVEDIDGFIIDEELHFEILEGFSGNHQLYRGWNWFSINWGSNHYQPDYLLQSIGGSASYIKSQTGFVIYEEQTGWCGSIDEFSPVNMYKGEFSEDAVLQWEGWDISSTPISIAAGWNWISFLPQTAIEINQALAGLGSNADYIKSQCGYAHYFENYGWIGSIEMMYPGMGYMIDANTDAVFSYPSDIGRLNEQAAKKPVKQALGFEHTASITAVINGKKAKKGDMFQVCAGDKILGSASYENNCIIDVNGMDYQQYIFLYLANDSELPETMKLRYYDAEKKCWESFLKEFTWMPDAIIGDLKTPVVLEKFQETETKRTEGVVIYPNPLIYGSYGFVNIEEKDRSSIGTIKIYNVKGQLVKEIASAAKSIVKWDLTNDKCDNVAAGIYIIETGEDIKQRDKLLILR